jgi:hypothetical protein
LAVTTTTASVSNGCSSQSQRHRLRVATISTIATAAAQPTCRDGIAAYWLANASVELPYTVGPTACPVSTMPVSDRNRGGDSGTSTCTRKAAAVSSASVVRAHRYRAGRRRYVHRRTAAVAGKCTQA